MGKIVLFADAHIHAHSSSSERLDNCIQCLEWIYSETEKRKIKHIIGLGDLFHDRHRLNIYSYQKVYDILYKYSSIIDSYFLIGNHDMFYRDSWDVTSIKPLSQIISVIDKPCTIRISGRNFDFLPYTNNPKENINRKSDVLMSHLAINGATINTLWNIKSDFEEEIEEHDVSIFSGYKKVFLGHYHARQKIDNVVEYIGSPLQLSFGEAMDKKGFVILDTETLETEFIENTFSPKHFILPSYESLKEYDIKNSYVKLLVSDLNHINLLELKHQIIKEYQPKSLQIIPVEKPKEIGKKEIKNIDIVTNNKKKLIEKFVKDSSTELDKKILVKTGLEVINQCSQEVAF